MPSAPNRAELYRATVDLVTARALADEPLFHDVLDELHSDHRPYGVFGLVGMTMFVSSHVAALRQESVGSLLAGMRLDAAERLAGGVPDAVTLLFAYQLSVGQAEVSAVEVARSDEAPVTMTVLADVASAMVHEFAAFTREPVPTVLGFVRAQTERRLLEKPRRWA